MSRRKQCFIVWLSPPLVKNFLRKSDRDWLSAASTISTFRLALAFLFSFDASIPSSGLEF